MKPAMKMLRLGALCALPVFLTSIVAAQDAKAPTQRNQVISLGQDGLVTGRVVSIDGPSKSTSPLTGVDVHFVHDGAIAQSTKTDSDGMFVVDGLTPGAYSFIAAGAKGFVAYGVVVKAAGEGSEHDSFMVAPAVSPRFIALREIVARHLPKKPPVLLEDVEMKTSLDGIDQIDDGANRISIIDGKVSGIVRSVGSDVTIGGTKVFLVQNDAIVSESVATDDGSFAFDKVAPGVYDFVAAGKAGFAAIGFEAIQESTLKTIVQQDPAAPVPVPVPAEKQLDSLLTTPADAQVVSDQVDHAGELAGDVASGDLVSATGMDELGDAIGCGGACGATGCGCEDDYYEGGCGGGDCCGAGGGGYGLGWLLPAALAAWAISENNDNNNNPPPPPPTSPAK